MAIEVNNTAGYKIDLALIKEIGDGFLNRYHKSDKSVSIAFVGDKKIRELNKKYRGLDKVTDILSFAGDKDDLGEIIIDFSQIKKQARKFGNSAKDELVFILIHGLLHLLGYNDETEKGREEMEKLGFKFIKQVKN